MVTSENRIRELEVGREWKNNVNIKMINKTYQLKKKVGRGTRSFLPHVFFILYYLLWHFNLPEAYITVRSS